MRKDILVGIFAGLIILQIAWPVSMIAQREATLKHGSVFRFKTAPVDPYDAFRGRYVALRVDVNKVRSEGPDLKYGQKVYAVLFSNEDGIAQVSQITLQKPHENVYMSATVRNVSHGEVALNLPIDRYYMEEKAAPQAERAYLEHSGRDKRDAYIDVRVRDGFAVIEGLYIGGKRIEDVIKK